MTDAHPRPGIIHEASMVAEEAADVDPAVEAAEPEEEDTSSKLDNDPLCSGVAHATCSSPAPVAAVGVADGAGKFGRGLPPTTSRDNAAGTVEPLDTEASGLMPSKRPISSSPIAAS